MHCNALQCDAHWGCRADKTQAVACCCSQNWRSAAAASRVVVHNCPIAHDNQPALCSPLPPVAHPPTLHRPACQSELLVRRIAIRLRGSTPSNQQPRKSHLSLSKGGSGITDAAIITPSSTSFPNSVSYSFLPDGRCGGFDKDPRTTPVHHPFSPKNG